MKAKAHGLDKWEAPALLQLPDLKVLGWHFPVPDASCRCLCRHLCGTSFNRLLSLCCPHTHKGSYAMQSLVR